MAIHDAKTFLQIVSLALWEFREPNFNAYRVLSQYKSDRNNFVNDFNTFVIATVEKFVFKRRATTLCEGNYVRLSFVFRLYPRISQIRK